MARSFLRVYPTRLAFITSSLTPNYDKVLTPGYDDEKDEPKGWAGIRRLFEKDKYGDPNAELIGLANAGIFSSLIGGLYGAAQGSRKSFHNFIENNEATKFANHKEAKRKLQDSVILGMGKEGMKWAIRIGSFSTIFITSVTLISAFLGGHGLTEYIVAGTITGALYKVNMGMRGMIAGGIVGTSLGTAAGILFNFMFWMTGVTLRELNEAQKEISLLRKKIAFTNWRKDVAEEYGPTHAETDKELEEIFGGTKK